MTPKEAAEALIAEYAGAAFDQAWVGDSEDARDVAYERLLAAITGPAERIEKALAALARYEASSSFTPCGVCLGHSPSWDGHDSGCKRGATEELIAAVRALSDPTEEQG